MTMSNIQRIAMEDGKRSGQSCIRALRITE